MCNFKRFGITNAPWAGALTIKEKLSMDLTAKRKKSASNYTKPKKRKK